MTDAAIHRAAIHETLFDIFSVGDLAYLRSLSRSALCAALRQELRWQGLIAMDDPATGPEIRSLLEASVDAWRKAQGL